MDDNEAYAAHEHVFGEGPDEWLVRHEGLIDSGARVLDVGAGQGRHALYLARRGLRVDALDASQAGLEQLSDAIAAERLPIRTIVGTWEQWDPYAGAYGTVLLAGLIQLVERRRWPGLVEKVTGWLGTGGLVFVTGHTTDDDGHRARVAGLAGWTRAGEYEYRSDRGEVRSYLRPGELARVFSSMEVVAVEESPGPEHRHGSGALERHARALGLFRRRGHL